MLANRVRRSGTVATIVVGLAGAVLLLPALGCSATSQAAADPQRAASAGIDDVVRRGQFRQTMLLTGELQARFGEPILVPRLPQWDTTIRWMVEDGAFVAEGDRLVELDTAQIASELQTKEGELQQAENQLASREAELEVEAEEKRIVVQRARVALRKAEIKAQIPEAVRTRKEFEEDLLAFEQARVAYDKAVAESEGHEEAADRDLEVLRIDLRSKQRELAEARRAIETMVLRAPEGGIVVVSENRREDRKYQVGDSTWVGAEVMEIPDLRRMMIQADLSDVDDGKVAVGMLVEATLDAYPERAFTGKIEALGPVAQEVGGRSMQRNFVVRVSLDVTDSEIMRPGMSVKVRALTATREDALLVPRRALVFDGDSSALRLGDGSLVPVTLGPCNASECVLADGPPEGTPLRGVL